MPKEKILVTSALPYVNNVPHMGNIIGCVLSADVFARFKRSQGADVLYVCGTDEHGTTTEAKAQEEGLTPQEICDKYYAIHRDVYQWFNISFDIFGRTSAQNHHHIVQGIYKDLKEKGYIVQKAIEQAYCPKDQKFLADRFITGTCPHCGAADARGDQCDTCGKLLDPLELKDAKCKICGTTPIRKESTHLFLDLPKLQPMLSAWFARRSTEGGWSQNAATTTQAWLDRGLEQRAITRDLTWGVPVPGMPGKVFYVWFDAPIGYISITGQRANTNWESWWLDPNVKLYQFMAKDNIPFHTILFPATLLGTGQPWTLLYHINATEYLQHEDGKFSKSRGTGLFADDAMRLGIPADVYRYYLLINRPQSADTLFAWKDVQDKLNSELLANLGNLVNRTLVFIEKYHEKKIHARVLDETAKNFLAWMADEARIVGDEIGRGQQKEALKRIMMLSSKANAYFQEQQPWRTRTQLPEACERAMYVLAHIIKDLAILIEPFLPSTSAAMFKQLGLAPRTWQDIASLSADGWTIGTPAPLFAKLEDADLVRIKEQLAKPVQKQLAPLQLRVGRIVEVYRHPQADKLFVETVDFGGELRTIVSGLVNHYAEEELRGKTALFITNLAPVTLRGIESQGMILTANGPDSTGKSVVDVLFVDADAGTYALGDGSEAQVTVDELFAHTLDVVGHAVHVDGTPLAAGTVPVTSERVADGMLK